MCRHGLREVSCKKIFRKNLFRRALYSEKVRKKSSNGILAKMFRDVALLQIESEGERFTTMYRASLDRD
jgi:hypothetical protein